MSFQILTPVQLSKLKPEEIKAYKASLLFAIQSAEQEESIAMERVRNGMADILKSISAQLRDISGREEPYSFSEIINLIRAVEKGELGKLTVAPVVFNDADEAKLKVLLQARFDALSANRPAQQISEIAKQIGCTIEIATKCAAKWNLRTVDSPITGKPMAAAVA